MVTAFILANGVHGKVNFTNLVIAPQTIYMEYQLGKLYLKNCNLRSGFNTANKSKDRGKKGARVKRDVSCPAQPIYRNMASVGFFTIGI